MNIRMNHKMSAHRRQGGVALVIGLILLLVLTMIGLSAIKTSTSQERMASGYQVQSQTFQSAESSLRMGVAQITFQPGVNMSLSSPYTNTTDMLSMARATAPLTPWAAGTATPPATGVGILPLKYSAIAADGTGFNSTANLYYTGTVGAKMSGASMGKFSAFAFEINAVAQQPSAGTRVNNILAVWFLVPKQQGF